MFLLACTAPHVDTHAPEAAEEAVVDTGAPTDHGPEETSADDTARGDTAVPTPPTDRDLRLAGDEGVQVTRTTVDVTGCSFSVTHYTPDEAVGQVVLSHGFLRSQEHMAELAWHLASWGLEVVTPDLCHASAWDADPEANGAELVRLAQALGHASPIYMGHSAGALASLVAAASDPSAAALVTLDLVDSGSLGADEASGVAAAAWGIFGEASMCNASGNGVDVVHAAGGRALQVVGADHCDFEGPTDSLCTAFCTGSSSFSDEEIQGAVRALATAAALDASGAGDATTWWSAGAWFELLEGEGRVTSY